MKHNILWQTVLTEVELQVSKATFQTFLSQTKLLSLVDEKAIIGCSKPMLVNLIESRYSKVLKEILDHHTKTDNTLVFKAGQISSKKHLDGPLFAFSRPEIKKRSLGIKLNPDYNFDTFAVSPTNQMAYAAATAVADSPGTSYNPLFLYGGVGVGKTHLMQAVGHRIITQKTKGRIIYCTGEQFTNEIIEAISNKTTTAFKKRYRNIDILLIDDVQFIAGKYSIQEEFFHTFNTIHQTKGQIILTSDKPPENINKLEARLKSRFEGGLTIDIGNPEFELRTAIILIKSKQHGIDLPIELAKLLSANIENTRKMEGVLIRIITESKMKNLPIDEDLIKEILGKTIKTPPVKKNVPEKKVLEVVCSYFNLKLSQIKGKRRDKNIAVPRQILYYILRVELGTPLMDIGKLIGGRDHSTVLHGVRKISKDLSTNEILRGDILGIKERVFE